MSKAETIKKYENAGKSWINGAKIEEIELNGKKFIFNENQAKFINELDSRYCLYSGGFGSGKSLALYIKMILFCLYFPNNRILLGRKTFSDIDRAVLPDLFELMPSNWYHHSIKAGLIDFFNGSQIILFALDALQEGSMADIKKAQQKVKSLNLGAYFIDQLEEVDEEVFESLNSRLRRTDAPIRQGNMTCNPANFWAYDFFKVHPKEDTFLITSSMIENKANLPQDYIDDQLKKDEGYIRRYVYGEWSMDVMLKSVVFSKDAIKRFELLARQPITEEEECKIYELPDSQKRYQMGIDPSEGSTDPSSICVVSNEGKEVARFNKFIPIHGLVEKVKFLYYKYHHPRIIPEVNAAGYALLEGIKDLNVAQRVVFEQREHSDSDKLGWKTSHASKTALISNFQNLLKLNFPQIYHKETIEEFKTFIWSDESRHKGAGAERGCHDDNVMATLLAFWNMEGYAKPKKTAAQIELEAGAKYFRKFKRMQNQDFI
ncbi:MAG: hypothetical protein HY764_01910 [Candidatus Portnoybacteria bacterium]|nr:hypothetical protein [Candidatus Portnoybacteria bacterium]